MRCLLSLHLVTIAFKLLIISVQWREEFSCLFTTLHIMGKEEVLWLYGFVVLWFNNVTTHILTTS